MRIIGRPSMRWLLMLALTTGFLIYCCWRADLYSAFSAGTVQAPASIDFGNVAPAVLKRSINIHNHTSRAVTIKKVTSDCGCTVTSIVAPAEIAAGAALECIVEFDVREKSGPVRKTIRLETDSPEMPVISLPVSGFVERPRTPTAVPAVVDFGRLGSWAVEERRVRILTRGTSPFTVSDVRLFAPDIECRIVSTDANSAELIVTGRGREVPGPLRGEIKVATSHGDTTIAVTGESAGRYFLSAPVFRCIPDDSGRLSAKLQLRVPPHEESVKVLADPIENLCQLRVTDVTRREPTTIEATLEFVPLKAEVALAGKRDFVLQVNGAKVSGVVVFVPQAPKGAS